MGRVIQEVVPAVFRLTEGRPDIEQTLDGIVWSSDGEHPARTKDSANFLEVVEVERSRDVFDDVARKDGVEGRVGEREACLASSDPGDGQAHLLALGQARRVAVHAEGLDPEAVPESGEVATAATSELQEPLGKATSRKAAFVGYAVERRLGDRDVHPRSERTQTLDPEDGFPHEGSHDNPAHCRGEPLREGP